MMTRNFPRLQEAMDFATKKKLPSPSEADSAKFCWLQRVAQLRRDLP